MTKNHVADIGVFGGSGFYQFCENVEEIDCTTPYGKPSDRIALANFQGKRIAFLPRHGKKHTLPPHKIPYRANLYAMKQLGVQAIIAPTAAGSLKASVKPGEFVVCDQFINFTHGLEDTFYDKDEVRHISAAHPYCPTLGRIAVEEGRRIEIVMHESGTVVVMQGPRFSTVAESRFFSQMGWSVINMTQYPECYLARELGICYTNVALITDFDVGLEGDPTHRPVTEEEVFRVFQENNAKVKNLLFAMIGRIARDGITTCGCRGAHDSHA